MGEETGEESRKVSLSFPSNSLNISIQRSTTLPGEEDLVADLPIVVFFTCIHVVSWQSCRRAEESSQAIHFFSGGQGDGSMGLEPNPSSQDLLQVSYKSEESKEKEVLAETTVLTEVLAGSQHQSWWLETPLPQIVLRRGLSCVCDRVGTHSHWGGAVGKCFSCRHIHLRIWYSGVSFHWL